MPVRSRKIERSDAVLIHPAQKVSNSQRGVFFADDQAPPDIQVGKISSIAMSNEIEANCAIRSEVESPNNFDAAMLWFTSPLWFSRTPRGLPVEPEV